MEQIHNILQNRFFSGAAVTSVSTDLQYVNNYYLNNTGKAETVVDFSNVRAFLSNPNNQKAVKAYYTFLTSSTLMNAALIVDPFTTLFVPTAEFKSIYYDDERLAESFNNYYNSTILRGINSNISSNPDIFRTSIINQLLPGIDFEFVTQDVFHNYYFWQSPVPYSPAYSPAKNPFFTAGTPYYTSPVLDIYDGDRDNTPEQRLVEVPLPGEYYFVNVLLLRRFTQTARMAFEACSDVIYKNINNTTTFSQNPASQIKFNDYFTPTPPVGVDNYALKLIDTTSSQPASNNNISTAKYAGNAIPILTYGIPLPGYGIVISGVSYYYAENELEVITPTNPLLIQCFVDPNFKTDENEFWADNPSPKVVSSSISASMRLSNLSTLERVDASLYSNSDFLDTSYLTPIIDSILSSITNVLLSGSYALSKQGTVYRSQVRDVDFSIENDHVITSISLDNSIVIDNFSKNEIASQAKIFIETILSAGLNIIRIHRMNSVENGVKVYVYSVLTNMGKFDLFLKEHNLLPNDFNPRLLNYYYILDRKLRMSRGKDLKDMQDFKPFIEPISINDNSFLRTT